MPLRDSYVPPQVEQYTNRHELAGDQRILSISNQLLVGRFALPSVIAAIPVALHYENPDQIGHTLRQYQDQEPPEGGSLVVLGMNYIETFSRSRASDAASRLEAIVSDYDRNEVVLVDNGQYFRDDNLSTIRRNLWDGIVLANQSSDAGWRDVLVLNHDADLRYLSPGLLRANRDEYMKMRVRGESMPLATEGFWDDHTGRTNFDKLVGLQNLELLFDPYPYLEASVGMGLELYCELDGFPNIQSEAAQTLVDTIAGGALPVRGVHLITSERRLVKRLIGMRSHKIWDIRFELDQDYQEGLYDGQDVPDEDRAVIADQMFNSHLSNVYGRHIKQLSRLFQRAGYASFKDAFEARLEYGQQRLAELDLSPYVTPVRLREFALQKYFEAAETS